MVGYVLFFLSLFAINHFIRDKKRMLLLSFIIITIFSGVRYGIGYDYFSYLEDCMPGSTGGDRFELIPRFFVFLSKQSIPFLFFILSSAFVSFFYYIAIRNGGSSYFMEILFYICFPFLFFNQLGIIRQAMASSVVFYALTLHDNKKNILNKILLLLLAFSCHHSAVVAVLLFFPWKRIPPILLWAMLTASFSLGLIMTTFATSFVDLGFLDEETSGRALKYLDREGQNEGNIIKYLIYLTTIIALFLYKKLVRRKKINAYYIGVLVLGASLFAMFDFNVSLAKRSCMFFYSVSIFLVPQIIQSIRIPQILYTGACILLFAINIYVSSFNIRYEDGPGESVSYPYRTYLNF